MNRLGLNIKTTVKCAIIGAIYAVATLALFVISYGPLQFRLSEALCVLPFIFPQSAWGLFVGCFLANLFSPAGAIIWDVIFGPIATLLCAKIISKLKNKMLIPWVMALTNGVIIGAVLAYSTARQTFWYSFALFGIEVAIGELVVGYIVGLPLLKLLEQYKDKLHI